MDDPTAADGQPLPAHAQLVEMATAHWVSHILYAAARLNLADHLASGPLTADALAPGTGTHAPSLYRLMRALASLGLLQEDGQQAFSLTPLGEALRSDSPGAARATVLTMASDWFIAGFGQLLHAVQTGESGFEKHLGMPIFDWLALHPQEASNFSATMVGFHGAEPAAVVAAYDFSGLRTIVDVGGATGHLLSTILASQPGSVGVLFDLPHVLDDAPALIASRGLSERVRLEAGSFFNAVPCGGDVYLLSHIIHDWSEEACLTILRHCRQAMAATSRLLIIEMVLPAGNTPHPGKLLDLMMLVGPGGRERTRGEYEALLAQADLRMTRLIPTASAVSIVEAVPA